jgi:chemotaxis signal transduction protein
LTIDLERPGHLCLFTCGPKRFALPVSALEGVIVPGPLVLLPLAPASLVGLCSHRRQAVPVFHLGGHDATRAGTASAVVMVRTEQASWGIRAERDGVTVIDAQVAPGPSGGFGAFGTVRHGGHSYTVLDPERAWQDLRSEVEREYSRMKGRRGSGPPASPAPDQA